MRRISGVYVFALSLLTALLVAPLPTSAPPAQAADFTPLPATEADKVVDGYGVGIHLPFLDTPYRDPAAVATQLQDLGVRHVRDDLYLGNQRQYDGIRTLAERGIKFNLIMGRPDKPGTPADYVRTVAEQLPPGAVESVEGVNEWDLFGGGLDWPTQLATWQQRLYDEVKANPQTSHLPVLSPALAFRWNYAALPDLSPYADKANAHMYPGGYKPSNEVTRITDSLRAVVPGKPLITTEAGYHNAMATTNGHRPVPEDVAATYAPRLLLEHLLRGEERLYSYELIDIFDDPARTNAEANFGLLRNDLTPKPAFFAMRNLIDLLEDPGPTHTTQPLPLASEGWPSDGRYLVTQKRDGRYVVLLWRDVATWEPTLQQRLPVTPANATLRFSKNYDMTVHRPSEGREPVARSVSSSLQLPMDGGVTAVTLDQAPPAPAPTGVGAIPGDRSMMLNWDLPETLANVTGFEITRNPGGLTTQVDADTRSWPESGLTNGTTYTYSVRALSPDGNSAPVSTTVTPATVPGAPPIKSTSVGTGSVTVTWGIPPANGRPITGYQLAYGTKTLDVGPTATKATLSGLPRRTQVRVAVRARNQMGWGAYGYTPYVKTK